MKAGVRPEVNLNGVARHRPVTKPARCGTANRGSGGEEEEEEGGRSSLGRSKRKRKEEHGAELNEGGADTTAEPSTPWSHQAKAEEPISKSKPAKNFLDEILAEKSRKKKKKRKRKHEKGKED